MRLFLALIISLIITNSANADPVHYSKELSKVACRDGIKKKAKDPASIRFHLYGFSQEIHENGNISIWQNFSAQNPKGDMVELSGYCLVFPDGSIETQITAIPLDNSKAL